MTRAAAPDTLRRRTESYSPAQRRTVDAALALFAEHGVGGTSLQMVAGAVGVTKAAVYHQFATKDAIVDAVLEVHLAPLEDALEAVEAEGASDSARHSLLDRVVDVAVTHRRALSTLQGDPALVRQLEAHPLARRLLPRLFTHLLGRALDGPSRVRAAVLAGALGSVGHRLVVDIDDDTVRRDLRAITAEITGLGR